MQSTRDSLKCRQSVTEPRDISRDVLISSLDTIVEVDDLVERVLGREVQVVNVTSETSAEGDGELLLEVTDLRDNEASTGGKKSGTATLILPSSWCTRWERRAQTSRRDLVRSPCRSPTPAGVEWSHQQAHVCFSNHRATHQVSHKPSIQLGHEQTQVRPQQKEARVSRDQEHFLARHPRYNNLEDGRQLSKELFVHSNFCCPFGCGGSVWRGTKAVAMSIEGRLFRWSDDHFGDSSAVWYEKLASAVGETVGAG